MFFHILLYDLRPSEVHARWEIKILVETVFSLVQANIAICRGDMIYNAIAKLF